MSGIWVTDTYEIDIDNITCIICTSYFQLVYPIDINIFPIGHSLFPIGGAGPGPGLADRE